MKIKQEDYEWLKEFIEPTVKEYCKTNLDPKHQYSDERIAWDLFWFSVPTKESGDFIVKLNNYGIKDSHLNTALIKIKRELFEKYGI